MVDIQTLATATGARLIKAGTQDLTGPWIIDSRTCVPGAIFVAFAGEHVDGNNYLEQALSKGAAAVVATRTVDPELIKTAELLGASIFEVDDAQEFLLKAAAAWRAANPQWHVVGITGSVGKTTTKEMTKAALSTRYNTYATTLNFNNLIGLPLTVLNTPAEAEAVVLEMGMNHKGEISQLTQVARPCVGVITTIGTSHIGLLGSQENIARAKAEIVEGLEAPAAQEAHVQSSSAHASRPALPQLIMPSATPYADFIASTYAKPAGIPVAFVNSSTSSPVSALTQRLNQEGQARVTLTDHAGWVHTVTLTIPGATTVDDALLALAVARALGCDMSKAADAIAALQPTTMRLAVSTTATGARVIDDSYNASPQSMASSLDVLCSMKGARHIAVLGEMGELGAHERELHSLVGAYAAAKPLDMLVCMGTDLAQEMAQGAQTMGFSSDKLHVFGQVDDALATLAGVFGADDVILVKASRAAGLDRFVKGIVTSC